jgi:hypothetical protein
MADAKTQPSSETNQERDGKSPYYFPDANDGQGGVVTARTRKEAEKLAEAGKFDNPNEAPAEQPAAKEGDK